MARKSEHLHGTIKRRKIATEDGTPRYELLRNGVVVAVATMTGRPGVDNYPWDWHTTKEHTGTHRGGSSDTLRNIVQTMEWELSKEAGRA